jgi:ABC-type uncharacterized transport system substrate-binding protein
VKRFTILDFRFSIGRSSSKKVFRHTFCALILALSFPAEAQQPKINRVGVLLPGEHWPEIIDGLRAGLKELKLEEGKQFVLEIRDTKGDLKAAETAARNLEEEKVNLIYTTRTSVTIAAKRVTAHSHRFLRRG